MSIYAQRRATLLEQLPMNTIALVAAGVELPRNGDADFRFRQDSSFHYLTGYPETNAIAVLIKTTDKQQYVLFNQERDLKVEQWTGPRIGQEGACEQYGADQAFPFDQFEEKIFELLIGCDHIYYPIGTTPVIDDVVTEWFKQLSTQSRAGIKAPVVLGNLAEFVDEMRLIKSADEIASMQQAADITVAAHRRIMQACQPGMYEYQIEAEIMHEFIASGARDAAYQPIVGGGKNACVLHYTDNNAKLNDGELLLVDAGVEYAFYASDITRTFPINGQFSPEQKAVYEVVLAAQEAAIQAVAPGNEWNAPHEQAVKVLTEGLVDIGLLQGQIDDLIEQEKYKQFYFHRTGHWLGLDVHDVGQYKQNGEWRPFQAGMALTVEPGLYINPAENVAEKWWNIGIRIEDDVVVTEKGCDVLTKAAPKKVDDVEALMRS